MGRLLFSVFVHAAVGAAVVLTASYMVYALLAMQAASRASDTEIARFGSPMGEIGIGIGLVIASLGVLIVCIRHVGAVSTGASLLKPREAHRAPPEPPVPVKPPSADERPHLKGPSNTKRVIVATFAVLLVGAALISYGLYPQGPLGALFPPEERAPRLGSVLDYDPFAEERE